MAYDEEKVYTIEGRSLDEIKDKLYSKYGSDYQIISRKTDFRPRLFSRAKEVQVVRYKIKNNNFSQDANVSIFGDYNNIPPKPAVNTVKPAGSRISDEDLEKNLKAWKDLIGKDGGASSGANADLLNKMSKQLEEMGKKMETMEQTIESTNGSPDEHPTILKIEEILSENEFTHSYIKMITGKIRKQFSMEQLEDFKLVERYVVDWIGESIEIAKEKTFRPPHVIIIVGPTGVGKTTTIAKMAAKSILDGSKENKITPEICIITIDTMRVGAMEQLEKYGDILNKNVLKAENPQDVKELYEEYKDHVDYIFIDTSGYSPNDNSKIAEMKNMLEVNMNADIYLAFTASTKSSDIQNIFRNYELFDYGSVIVTKHDETKCFGNVISMLWEKHKAISYITDGQKVPRNIKRANVIDILLSLNGFDIDRVHIENVFGEQ